MHDYEVQDLVDDDGRCLRCGSKTGIKYPRGCSAYCEDCGYPEEEYGEGW